ncbi:MAG TPA: carboxypeptidase regulatory-like domain-containing protein [Candidatus Acidoferrales bacterium]|nr:carboxypeptidase regulatory-like domain-containing protein [Candidatus Acidoferrales bacterium]
MKKLSWLVCASLLAIGMCPGRLRAQATASASLAGTITDQSNAVVDGAQVTVTNKATGETRSVKTAGAGYYRFDLLPAGTYQLAVTMQGFQTVTVPATELLVGDTATVNVTLKPGSVSQTITVTEVAPLVDVTKTSVGLDITPQQVQDMPLNGRDFGNLAFLAPGARPVGSYDPTKNRVSVFATNGSNGRNVNVTVNGIDDKDNTVGGPVMQLPLSAVQEFNISTQRFSAANGRSEGAAVNVITKSGSNQFHGSGYFFDTQTALNANDFFSKQSGGSTPQFERQQFGGDIGGPIRRNKDFFFFALEREREHTAIPVTAEALNSLTLAEAIGAQPASTIPTPYFDWRYTGRLDHRFSANESAFFTYNAQKNFGLNDQSGNTNDLTAGNFTTNHLILANLTLNSVFSPSVVNAFTAGYQYWNNVIDTSKFSPATVSFPDGSNFGTNGNVPQESIQKKWQFREDLSILHGNHTFRTGVDFVWEPELGGFFEFTPVPTLTFLDNPSVILGKDPLCGTKGHPICYPQGFATPGAVNAMTGAAGDPNFFLQGGSKMVGIYFQDDWKVRPRFMLNLGMRWDKDIGLIAGNLTTANRTYQELKAINSPYASKIPGDDNRGISPRIGFAWDMRGNAKHILSGGYGLYFGQTFINIPLFMMQLANPVLFVTTYSLSTTGPGDPTCTPATCTVPGTNILLSNWRFGVDPLPVSPPGATQLKDGNTGRIMDPNYRNPYSEQWNADYEYAISSNSVLEIDYVHELGLHESNRLNLNPTVSGARVLTPAFDAAGVAALGPIVDDQSAGRSRYDGMNVSYRRRMSNHFSLNASYVLSRAVGYDGNAASFGNSPINPFDQWSKADFGPVPNDERHHVALGGVINLPWSFEVSPVMQFGTARPYTATAGLDVLRFGARQSAAHAVVPANNPTDYTFFSSATSKDIPTMQACLSSGSCIMTPLDSLRGQDFFQMDARVAKDIRFGDRATLKLIFQGFDLTNRANFGNSFGGNVRSSTFRTATNYLTPSGVIVPKSFRGEFGIEVDF